MAGAGELLVVCVDVSRSMNERDPGDELGRTKLQLAIRAVNIMMENMIVYSKKDEVALLLYGANDTCNELNEADPEQYRHVSVLQPLGKPRSQLLKALADGIVPGDGPADCLDALIVAMAMLKNANDGRKTPAHGRIVLFTDAMHPCNDEEGASEAVKTYIQSEKIKLQVIGIEDDDDDTDEEGEEEEGEDPADRAAMRRERLRTQFGPSAPVLADLVRESGGDTLGLVEAIAVASKLRRRTIRQTTTCRVNLEIADLKIPVWGFVRMQIEPLPRLKQIAEPSLVDAVGAAAASAAANVSSALGSASAAPMETGDGMKRVVTKHEKNNDDVEVDKTNLVKAYKYGKTYVPWLEEDEENMRLKTEKQLAVLGFTSVDNVPPWHYMEGKVIIFVPKPGDKTAAVAISALAEALHAEKMAAIVRYVFRAKANPKLGCLLPHVKPHYVGLMYITVPFRDDVRPYVLPSLDKSEFRPTLEQNKAMDDFIKKMDLSTADTDDDGNPAEALKPKMTWNPVLHYIIQCMHARAVHPDEPLPDLDPAIKKYLMPEDQLLRSASSEIQTLRDVFPLKPNEALFAKSRKDEAMADIFNKASTEADEQASKRSRLSGAADGDDAGAAAAASSAPLSMDTLMRKEVTAVGSTDPVKDFQAMVKRGDADTTRRACEQMVKHITDTVELFVGGSVDKFRDMVKTLRSTCAGTGALVGEFNGMMQALRGTFAARGAQVAPLQTALVEGGVLPISSAENAASTLSPDAAATFFSDDEPAAAPAVAAPTATDDPDDLLDEL